jgi:D-amino-acid oxidase
LALNETVIVNCLGLGARCVPGDPAVMPIRGQLVVCEPAPRPFFIDHALGYVISRRDRLLLGGTFEEGVEEAAPEEQTCRRILENHRRFFGEVYI